MALNRARVRGVLGRRPFGPRDSCRRSWVRPPGSSVARSSPTVRMGAALSDVSLDDVERRLKLVELKL